MAAYPSHYRGRCAAREKTLIVEVLLHGARFVGAAFLGLLIGLLGLLALSLSGTLVRAAIPFRQSSKRTVVTPNAPAAIKGRMARLARPSLLMTPSKQLGFSQLGGAPQLPENLPWPANTGAAHAFLAQFSLAEVRAAGGPDWLGEDGRIYAFYDDRRMGFADLVSIVHSRDAPGPAASPPADMPAELRFPESRVSFLAFKSVPSLDWLGVDLRELNEKADWEALDALSDSPFADQPQHRIGGYPDEIQEERMSVSCERLWRGLHQYSGEASTPAIERASKAWRLLLQIDSDPALKMNWGDGGRLYVFIREKDARAGDFSKTVTLFQCY